MAVWVCVFITGGARALLRICFPTKCAFYFIYLRSFHEFSKTKLHVKWFVIMKEKKRGQQF
jgi:hypothetical protein